jgi:uncharacterized protein
VTNQRAKVCIHHTDSDGYGSAYVDRQARGGENWTGIPCDYDPGMTVSEVEQCRDADVTILDVSLPPETLAIVCALAHHVTLLDHRASAFDKYRAAGLIGPGGTSNEITTAIRAARRILVIDPSGRFSGVSMTWEHYYGTGAWENPAVPHLLRAIEDHDLWRFKLPYTREFLAAISAQELTVDAIQGLVDTPQGEVVSKGSTILSYQHELIRRHVERAAMLPSPLGPIPVVECSVPEIISHLGAVLAVGHPYAVIWSYRHATRHVRVSLRSVEGGADVRAIAEMNGGGGHKHAARYSESVVSWCYALDGASEDP